MDEDTVNGQQGSLKTLETGLLSREMPSRQHS
jgi:hypothetical protein